MFIFVIVCVLTVLIAGMAFIWPNLLEKSEFLSDGYRYQPLSTAKNRYPILIHHGFLPITGLHRFAKDLNQHGCVAFSSQVVAANSVMFRAAQLAEQIERALRLTGAEKVNIIAHSMGGLDSRYLISSMGYGNRIASLTTFSTPHRGCEIASYLINSSNRGLAKFFDLLGILFVPGSKYSNMDTVTATLNLSTAFAHNFNLENLDDPQVRYFSWAGNAERVMTGEGSIGQWFMRPLWRKIAKRYGPNDMLVTVESAKWGEYQGEIPADHFSQIGNRLFLLGTKYEPTGFFRRVSDDLAAKGL